jgi:uncharacterized RDD family membrane protein YckC
VQEQNGETPLEASFLARSAAFLLDWAIVLLIAVFLAGGIGADQTTRLVIGLVTLSVYHIAFLIAMSATPGKMALRMHVSNEAGRRLEPDQAILRFLVFFVSVLTVVGLGISAAMVLVDPHRRSVHDRVARTRVRYGRPDYEGDRR